MTPRKANMLTLSAAAVAVGIACQLVAAAEQRSPIAASKLLNP